MPLAQKLTTNIYPTSGPNLLVITLFLKESTLQELLAPLVMVKNVC